MVSVIHCGHLRSEWQPIVRALGDRARASVRWRLALSNGLAVSLLLVVLAGAQYAAMAHMLVQRTAMLVETQARQAGQRDVGPRSPADLDVLAARRMVQELGTKQTYVWVFDRQEQMRAESPGIPEDGATETTLRRAVAKVLAGARGVIYEQQTATLGHLLIAVLPVQRGPRGPIIGALSVGVSLAEIDATLRNLAFVDLVSVVVGIAIAVGTAPLVGQTALAPLRIVTQAAKAIAGGDLRQRATLTDGWDEVGELGRAFNNMADRVEAMLIQQRRFVADASHELRTPLTVVASGLDVLELEAADGAARQRLIGRLRTEITRMGRLIQELLDLASYDRGITLERRQVDVAAMIRDVADEVRLLGPEHMVIDEAPAHALAVVDPDRIRQLLLILADNAVAHTPPGSEVHLGVWQVEGTLVLEVRDNGGGIAPELLPQIFDRFFRVDTARARAGGHAGLGLAIARGIVEAHGGQITATSTVGEGTRVTVRLPASPRESLR